MSLVSSSAFYRGETEADKSTTLTQRCFAEWDGEVFSYYNSEGHQVLLYYVLDVPPHTCTSPYLLLHPAKGLQLSLQVCSLLLTLLFQRPDSPSYAQT